MLAKRSTLTNDKFYVSEYETGLGKQISFRGQFCVSKFLFDERRQSLRLLVFLHLATPYRYNGFDLVNLSECEESDEQQVPPKLIRYNNNSIDFSVK